MSLPFERTRAVNHARGFLQSLTDPQQTPRIPKDIRQQARAILLHYPTPFDLKAVVAAEQYIFGEQK